MKRRHRKTRSRPRSVRAAQPRAHNIERDLERQGSRQSYTDAMCREAVAIVDRSGLVALCEERLPQLTGRPRHVSHRTLLCVLALVALDGRGPMYVSNAARAAYGLSDDQRAMFGLTRFSSRTLRSTFESLAGAMQETVDPTTGEVLSPALGIDVDAAMSRLARGGIPTLVPDSGTKALDGTAIESPYQRRSTSKDRLPDILEEHVPVDSDERAPVVRTDGWPRTGPDGRLVHTIDPDAREGWRGKKSGQSSIYNGYEAHLVVDVPDLGSDPVPAFVRGVSLRGAGDDRAEGGQAALDHLVRRPGTVLADRGYTYLTPWGSSIIGQGIEQYLDLHPVQRKTGPGPRPGTIWVDGQLYSDALPERMWELPGYRMGMTSDERAELGARYDEREPYRFADYGAPEPGTGKVRLRGPAVTGRVRCDNTPSSKRLKRTASRPTTSCCPGQPCGCSVTVVLDP